jgi:hypothetical protein
LKVTEPTLSKIRGATRKMPDALKRWFMIKASFGGVYVKKCKGESKLLRILQRALEDREYATLIQTATAFIAAYGAGDLSGEGPEFLPRLHAFRAVGHRATGSVGDAIKDYEEAISLARVSAPHLCRAYEISLIVWESERVDNAYKMKTVGKTYRDRYLRDMVRQLTMITPGHEEEDEDLRLKALLRNLSRLDDRKLHDHWLAKARKHEGFGKTPEKRDAYLRRWMSEKNDPDGDFKNARSYQSYTDLWPLGKDKQ